MTYITQTLIVNTSIVIVTEEHKVTVYPHTSPNNYKNTNISIGNGLHY